MKQGEPDRFGGVAAQLRKRRCYAAITRSLLLAVLVLGVSGWNFAWGQAAMPGRDRPARIGILFSNARIFAPAEHPVFVGLREAGWLDGQNTTLILRDAEGRPGRLPELAADLVAAKPDVIITAGPQAVLAAKNATTTIPIVFAVISDPVTYGVVASLAHPGGNLTGLSMVNTVLSSKRRPRAGRSSFAATPRIAKTIAAESGVVSRNGSASDRMPAPACCISRVITKRSVVSRERRSTAGIILACRSV